MHSLFSEAAGEILYRLPDSELHNFLVTSALGADFPRSSHPVTGKGFGEQENKGLVVLSPFFCLSPLIYIKNSFL